MRGVRGGRGRPSHDRVELSAGVAGMHLVGTSMRGKTVESSRPSDGRPPLAQQSSSLYGDGSNGYGSGSSSLTSSGGHSVAHSLHACIKVFCTSVAPCYALPWVRGEESHQMGSGFAVELPSGERRLIVHATAVDNHTLVQVRRLSEAQKYVATVECIGYDVEIAVLQVADESFWRSLPLLPLLEGLPAAMSEVVTAGFPAGGEELSTTRGVVNRILVGGNSRELCVQTDVRAHPHATPSPLCVERRNTNVAAAAAASPGRYVAGPLRRRAAAPPACRVARLPRRPPPAQH